MAQDTQHHPGRASRIRLLAWGSAAALLLTPLIAMQVTDGVAWTPGDFLVFGALLLGAGLALELGTRVADTPAYRWGIATAVAAGFLLVWINLAVGVIGSSGHPANLVFLGVLLVAAAGAMLARFRPRGMARAIAATGLAQAASGAVALVAGWGAGTANLPWDVLGLTVIFTALWLASATQFSRAARRAPSRSAA